MPARKPPAAPRAPDLSNLAPCVADARAAVASRLEGPPDPVSFDDLVARLDRARDELPPLYRTAVLDPFARTLRELGAAGFRRALDRDPRRQATALLLLDVAQALLQAAEGTEPRATPAFQEVVSDLYDGFLSAEDRRGVKPPDRGVVAPLVKWGRPDFGPYTLTVEATRSVGAAAGVVSLPPSHAGGALLGWAALGHETAGHDVLGADVGLEPELAAAVAAALRKAGFRSVADYWADRIGETASDVMGILNMGPAAAVGLVGYFRGLRGAIDGEEKLQAEGPDWDEHPADAARGYLAAAAVRLLAFAGREAWARQVEAWTDEDAPAVVLAGVRLSRVRARRAAAAVAGAIVRTPMASLEHHALGEIQTWRDGDERVAERLRATLASAEPLPEAFEAGTYAAHAMAAAVELAASPG
ncbi:MAG TPA: hypothetical protein VH880_14935, partial [Anaeromyxobacteraceae bacterium]